MVFLHHRRNHPHDAQLFFVSPTPLYKICNFELNRSTSNDNQPLLFSIALCDKASLTGEDRYTDRKKKESRCGNKAVGKPIDVFFILQQTFIPIAVFDKSAEPVE